MKKIVVIAILALAYYGYRFTTAADVAESKQQRHIQQEQLKAKAEEQTRKANEQFQQNIERIQKEREERQKALQEKLNGS